MSLASWKKEFYSKSAYETSKKDALQHDLITWTGLLRKNRRKHKVSLNRGVLMDDLDELAMFSDSCALCQNFMDFAGCLKCPLTKILNPQEEDKDKFSGFRTIQRWVNSFLLRVNSFLLLNNIETPCKDVYSKMIKENKVVPMINALKRALKINGG